MKKLLVVLAIVVLTGSGIFAAGYFNSRQADRLKNVEASDAPKSEADHHEDVGVDPKGLPLVDLTNEAEVRIDIKDYLYDKPNIKIKKGTKVTWINQDVMKHNAMREHDGEEHAHDAPSRAEVRNDLFAGPLLDKGESYSFTFDKVESLGYHCAPHPYMKGAITVVE